MKKRLYSVIQACDYSGESRSTLYKEMKEGNLRFVKMGSSTRLEGVELDRYIDEKIQRSAA